MHCRRSGTDSMVTNTIRRMKMGMMNRLYTDIQEMISMNCTEDQVIDFVAREYGFSVSEAQEMIAEFMYEEERMILATGYN